MQKHANLVDLVKSFPTKIFLQNLASIQKRTSPKSLIIWLRNKSKVRYRTFQLRSLPLSGLCRRSESRPRSRKTGASACSHPSTGYPRRTCRRCIERVDQQPECAEHSGNDPTLPSESPVGISGWSIFQDLSEAHFKLSQRQFLWQKQQFETFFEL